MKLHPASPDAAMSSTTQFGINLKLQINAHLAADYNAVSPRDFGPAWQLGFQFLFPK
jgi:hypothetical protein